MKKNYFTQHHFGALIAWLVAIILAVVFLPNISQLVRDYGQTKIPATAQSQVANAIQKDWGRGQGNTRQVVVVFSNGNDKLTATQKDNIKDTVSRLRDNDKQLHIKDVLAPNDNAATKKQLISKDKTTQLVQLQVDKKQQVRTMTKKITSAAKTNGVKTYVTGGDILNDDFQQETEDGIKKTEVIAAIFIFIVLVLVFRSPVVPLVSLATVGVAVITSLSVVMNLVAHFGFPLSSFTQVFLVVVLFGIGTDYNILLYDQYKEELSGGLEPVTATTKARKIAGRTILYSGSSLLIGFSALGLAKFSIYQSAVGVAVGVAVLLLVLLTLNPFFMAILGKRMFWPTKNFAGGSRSKMWARLSKSAVFHPLLALGLVIILAIPAVITYNNNLNYDTTAELADDLPAKVGFRVVQKHFSKGTAEPATLYIQSDKPLNKEKYLRVIDRVNKKLQSEDGVKTVASVTEPSGSSVKQLYEGNQLGTVTSGMGDAGAGLAKINKGLTAASKKIASTDMSSGLDGVKTMIAGTNQLKTGSTAITSGADQLADGSGQLASATQQLTSGASVLESGIGTLDSGLQKLSSNSGTVDAGVDQLSNQSAQLPLAIAGLAAYNQQINSGTKQLSMALAAGQNQLSGLSSQQANMKSILSQAQSMQQELSTAKTMLSQADQMLAMLDRASASKDTLESMATMAGSLGTLQTTLTKTVTSTATNDGEIAKLATGLTQSSDATTAATGKQIAELAAANVQSDQTLSDGLKPTLASLSKVDSGTVSQLAALAKAIPDASEVAGLKKQLTQTSQMVDSASNLLSETNQLGSSLNKLSALPTQMAALSAGLQKLQAATGQASSIATQLNSKVNGSGVNLSSQASIQSTIGNSTLSSQLQQLASGIKTYTAGVDTAANGSSKLYNGAGTLASGAGQITTGATKLQTGASTLASKTPALTSGLNQELSGQKTMYSTLKGVVGQMGTLETGLNTAGKGIGTVNKGVGSAQSYLTGLKNSAAADDYYVPKKILKGKTYKQAIDTYMSSDHKTTKMTIVLDTDPAAYKSMDRIDKMQKVVQNELKGTALKNAKVAIGGQTAQTSDTHKIASSDFTRTAAIMIVGILLALMLVTRSILQPFYIIGTLLIAYIASLGITRLLSTWILGQPQLTWNTPFFTFVMLLALGVDYSIFLMMKYREFDAQIPNPKARIMSASAVIGAVVISAAIILSGTFAALMPSGVLTLIQVAMGVIVGLVLLVIFIPVILPALISLTYGGNDKEGKHEA